MKTQADGSVQEWTRPFLSMTVDLLALDALAAEPADRGHGEGKHRGLLAACVQSARRGAAGDLSQCPAHARRCPVGRRMSRTANGLPIGSRHGLLKASFIPPRPVRELRDLMRYRKTIVQERAYAGQSTAKSAGNGEHQAVVGGD